MKQTNELKNNIQKILDNLRVDGNKQLKKFEKTVQKCQKKILAELSKTSK